MTAKVRGRQEPAASGDAKTLALSPEQESEIVRLNAEIVRQTERRVDSLIAFKRVLDSQQPWQEAYTEVIQSERAFETAVRAKAEFMAAVAAAAAEPPTSNTPTPATNEVLALWD